MSKQLATSMLNFAGDVLKGATRGSGVTGSGNTVNKAIKQLPKTLNNNASRKTMQNSMKKVDPSVIKGNGMRVSNGRINRPTMALTHTAETGGTKFGNFLGGGIRDTTANMKKGQGFGDALSKAHKGKDGNLALGKVAGTGAALGVAGRVVTGGGLYKDQYGRTNLPGIPFI